MNSTFHMAIKTVSKKYLSWVIRFNIARNKHKISVKVTNIEIKVYIYGSLENITVALIFRAYFQMVQQISMNPS